MSFQVVSYLVVSNFQDVSYFVAIYKEKEYFWQMFQGRIYYGISYKCSKKISLGNFLLMLRVLGLWVRTKSQFDKHWEASLYNWL